MAQVNSAGAVVGLEGGDVATIGLMAAHLRVHDVESNPEDAAQGAVTLYLAVVKQVNKFNQSHRKPHA